MPTDGAPSRPPGRHDGIHNPMRKRRAGLRRHPRKLLLRIIHHLLSLLLPLLLGMMPSASDGLRALHRWRRRRRRRGGRVARHRARVARVEAIVGVHYDADETRRERKSSCVGGLGRGRETMQVRQVKVYV